MQLRAPQVPANPSPRSRHTQGQKGITKNTKGTGLPGALQTI
jgi:hypothetical protein